MYDTFTDPNNRVLIQQFLTINIINIALNHRTGTANYLISLTFQIRNEILVSHEAYQFFCKRFMKYWNTVPDCWWFKIEVFYALIKYVNDKCISKSRHWTKMDCFRVHLRNKLNNIYSLITIKCLEWSHFAAKYGQIFLIICRAGTRWRHSKHNIITNHETDKLKIFAVCTKNISIRRMVLEDTKYNLKPDVMCLGSWSR